MTELDAITADLSHLAQLYRFASELYLESLRDKDLRWVRRAVETGLRPVDVTLTRRLSQSRLEPMMQRVDYVDVLPGQRHIAEVQWKSGGPGYFIGHQSAFLAAFPPGPGELPIDDLPARYLDALSKRADFVGPGLIVNEVRAEWLQAERQFERPARSQLREYRAIDRATLAEAIEAKPGQLLLRKGDSLVPISVLRGRGFTERLSETTLESLVDQALDGRLWLETPPNFIYRQKWPLALPFMQDLCPDHLSSLRDAIAPTSMLGPDRFDLSAICSRMAPQDASALSGVGHLLELGDLPTRTRAQLVLKCAAGSGDMHSRGRGVFRINGSGPQVASTLRLIKDRQETIGEPWIAQLYVGREWGALLAHPEDLDAITRVSCRLRLMVFGQQVDGPVWSVQGGVANLSPHWKVSGADAKYDARGALLGSAFTDVRMASPGEAL